MYVEIIYSIKVYFGENQILHKISKKDLQSELFNGIIKTKMKNLHIV